METKTKLRGNINLAFARRPETILSPGKNRDTQYYNSEKLLMHVLFLGLRGLVSTNSCGDISKL